MPLGQGYRALREGAAWLDLSDRGLIRITGEDRTRLLHTMATNHIQQLKPGEGCYTFFLDSQGHILADANVLCQADAFLLDTEPETRHSLYAHLDTYIIADDVTLEDVSDMTAALSVEGPEAERVLRTLQAPMPATEYAHELWGERVVARMSTTGASGFRIYAPREQRSELVHNLQAAGAAPANADEFRTVRIEHGRPRYGEDISSKNLPQETQQLHAVHFAKGCYIGQEIVERVRSRGAVHRLLVHLEIGARVAPRPDVRILANGKEVGALTSAAYSPAFNRVVAFGYVRMADITPQTQLTIEGAASKLVPAVEAPGSV